MSEPTYRVELIHDPASEYPNVPWSAEIFRITDGERVYLTFEPSREAAFNDAQAWIKRQLLDAERPSTVFLTEDGDILDPHEVQR